MSVSMPLYINKQRRSMSAFKGVVVSMTLVVLILSNFKRKRTLLFFKNKPINQNEMKARYFKSAEDVNLIDPMQRFWAKIFGKDRLVIKCKDCKQIPTEYISGYCWDCLPKSKKRN